MQRMSGDYVSGGGSTPWSPRSLCSSFPLRNGEGGMGLYGTDG